MSVERLRERSAIQRHDRPLTQRQRHDRPLTQRRRQQTAAARLLKREQVVRRIHYALESHGPITIQESAKRTTIL
jgi:hypothetical protein